MILNFFKRKMNENSTLYQERFAKKINGENCEKKKKSTVLERIFILI